MNYQSKPRIIEIKSIDLKPHEVSSMDIMLRGKEDKLREIVGSYAHVIKSFYEDAHPHYKEGGLWGEVDSTLYSASQTAEGRHFVETRLKLNEAIGSLVSLKARGEKDAMDLYAKVSTVKTELEEKAAKV